MHLRDLFRAAQHHLDAMISRVTAEKTRLGQSPGFKTITRPDFRKYTVQQLQPHLLSTSIRKEQQKKKKRKDGGPRAANQLSIVYLLR
jgi:hypothetical protein